MKLKKFVVSLFILVILMSNAVNATDYENSVIKDEKNESSTMEENSVDSKFNEKNGTDVLYNKGLTFCK